MYRNTEESQAPFRLAGEWMIVEVGNTHVPETLTPFLVLINRQPVWRYLCQDESVRTVAMIAAKSATARQIGLRRRSKMKVIGKILNLSKWVDRNSIKDLPQGFQVIRWTEPALPQKPC